ncbi:MAG: SDR family oxidoreductase [Candidatus Pseudobacter hemicellulosilyticus]|uniref:SDR family oxidoreductase n=1 Tax=Candidatus Pseudobacter hemicellulosilyticus TaxID=3121375 RepID=A0AAJ6BGX3_9BACT|nr:MAG: SDR family oxidoreductase [Pseudobacter sp.]
MDLSLKGKYALVCGSTQGIGLAIARELAILGAHCTLLSRNEGSLKEALLQLDATAGQQHGYLVADFSQPETVSAAITRHVAANPVHILINNTGGPPPGPIVEATTEDFLKTFNQHLVCNHILATAVTPSMKAAQYGRIINIISTSVRIPLKNLGVSNTIRGAVASWAKTLSLELGQFNITVNNVLPGFTTTARLEGLVKNISANKQQSEAQVSEEMAAEVPMKRFGKPEEVAAVAAFLATPAAAYVNGVSIPVDGGRTGSI